MVKRQDSHPSQPVRRLAPPEERDVPAPACYLSLVSSPAVNR